MASATSGAVFFLGSRAHYQVLQQPETSPTNFDIENGNAIDNCNYHNHDTAPDLWSSSDILPVTTIEKGQRNRNQYLATECGAWMSCGRMERNNSDVTLIEYSNKQPDANGCKFGSDGGVLGNNGVTRRFRKKLSSGTLQENEAIIEIDPAVLNKVSYRKSSRSDSLSGQHFGDRCGALKALIGGLKSRRRKRKLSLEGLDNVECLEPYILKCTYKDSCRCLDCQSRYFECDESDSEYSVCSVTCEPIDIEQDIITPSDTQDEQITPSLDGEYSDDDDEEVFVDNPPDNVSTEFLLDEQRMEVKIPNEIGEKMSVSSDEVMPGATQEFNSDAMELEMAAGTPIVLDYLLNHPVTCAIQ